MDMSVFVFIIIFGEKEKPQFYIFLFEKTTTRGGGGRDYIILLMI